MKSRTRMVSFRLSAEEYERFRERCLTSGTRSVSEMVRTAINLFLEQPARVPLEARVAELEGRLHMLAMEMKKIEETASQLVPPPRSSSSNGFSFLLHHNSMVSNE